MDTLRLKIEKIKNITAGDIEIPLECGVYALVGTNGCGKSTILLSMAQMVSRHYLGTLRPEDFSKESKVIFEINGKSDVWCFDENQNMWTSDTFPKTMKLNGMYEGSLFYGTRFNDSTKIDKLLGSGKLKQEEIVDADEYIIKTLSFILHGDYEHYLNLKRVRNRTITERIGVSNTPYFNKINDYLISQYRMSSGECLLVSLLHFIYNAIIRKSLPTDEKILVLIDEIELALHPIAVTRLVKLLNDLVKDHQNLVVILSSHSPEVIKSIKPANLYKVENKNGQLSVQSNCYPSYLIRDVYDHDGFDFLLLVEDVLAKYLVDKILNNKNLKSGKLVHVVPVGGWSNTLYLHKDLLRNNILGLGKIIISVLDGDIADEVPEEYKDIKKLFLPIASIEKYLYDVIIGKPNANVIKLLNDKYFTIKSIDSLVKEFNIRYHNGAKSPSSPDKKFYFSLKKNLEERNISENYFINNLCDDLLQNVDFSTFAASLRKMLE